jgi:hypothetical protein
VDLPCPASTVDTDVTTAEETCWCAHPHELLLVDGAEMDQVEFPFFAKKINFAEDKTRHNGQPFRRNFACFNKAGNIQNSVSNNQETKKYEFCSNHCKTKSKLNFVITKILFLLIL